VCFPLRLLDAEMTLQVTVRLHVFV